MKTKNIIIPVILIIVLITLFFCGIAFSSPMLSYSEFIEGLTNPSSTFYTIIYKIRLPRVLGALFAGVGLALSGFILQSLMQNDLVSPNTIGISSGAGLSLVLGMILFSGLYQLFPLFAFVGAILTTLLIYVISAHSGNTRYTTILAGIAVVTLFSALMKILFIYFPDAQANSNAFMIGTLASVGMKEIIPSMIIITICTILTIVFYKPLNILTLGDKTASSLGLNVKFYRAFFLVIAALLAASVVAYAGLIGFVGLIVPHISKLITKNKKHAMLLTILIGAIFVIGTDLLTRLLFRGYEVPVGIAISIIGAPFFIYLLIRKRG